MPKDATTQLIYETNALLREMRVDVSYIKNRVEEHKEEIQEIKKDVEEVKSFRKTSLAFVSLIAFVCSAVASKVLANLGL